MGGRRQHSFAALAPPADLTIVAHLLPPAMPWLMYMPASCGMSGNLLPALQGSVQMVHVGGLERWSLHRSLISDWSHF